MIVTGDIGLNANGNLDNAKMLIDLAKHCGCDAVKFQKRTIDTVYSREFLDSPRESPWGKTQRQQKEGLEFGQNEYDEIDRYCKEIEIDWYASAWDIKSQLFLREYRLKYNKVASAMLTNYQLLGKIAEEKKLTFISTGMSTIQDIDKAVEIFESNKCPYILMHCVSVYPCPDNLCNLQRIGWLSKKYSRKMLFKGVGYSGHELGITPSLIAVSLGASAIERHITLNRADYGSDQSASLEKRGLELLIREAKLIRQMITSDVHQIETLEKPIAKKLRWHEEILCPKG
jgi:N-acetylneuraminate synthase